jgi:hypothetical protein
MGALGKAKKNVFLIGTRKLWRWSLLSKSVVRSLDAMTKGQRQSCTTRTESIWIKMIFSLSSLKTFFILHSTVSLQIC